MTPGRVAIGFCAIVLAASATLACQPPPEDLRTRGRDALRRGQYDEAVSAFRGLVGGAAATEDDRRSLVRALVETGEYAEAERVIRELPSVSGSWAVALGDVALLQGRLDLADSLFRAAAVAPAGGSVLVAGARLGTLLRRRGRAAEARQRLLAVARAADRGGLSSTELAAAASAYRALGGDDPARFRTALRLYDAAVATDSTNLEARLALGDLFLEKYNRPDALQTFEAILAVNPNQPEALLGKALVMQAEGTGDPEPLLRKALEENPRLVGARVALALSHMDREAYPQAALEAERALETDPVSLEALTALAAAHLFQGDTARYEQARRRVFAVHPTYAEFHASLAEQSARNRFYRRATEFAADGVRLDSTSARALAVLGVNQLRIGAMPEGREALERAFALDPYNVWVKNTLDLLDAVKGYVERASPRFRFVAAPEEVDLLAPYLTELAEEGYERLAAQYGYRPPTPIRVELYRHHADFSVRTVGLAGLGALGVSFGSVLAMDAPSARPRGEFNWGSTLWHELAHAFTLGVTDHRIPRWFSEGLSVLEERRARPGWGGGARLAFLQAYHAGRLLPVSRLNDGFVRPAFPEQVAYSYYQASLVCEMIEATRGPEAIRGMLDGYRQGWSTDDVFRRALRAEPELFDREFDRWFRERFGSALDAVRGDDGGPFRRELEGAIGLASGGRAEEAIAAFERARALFPEYAEQESPYWHLAKLHRAAGRLREAAEMLGRLTALAETNYEANVEEADVREALGDRAGAAAALERAVYIDPRDPALHRRLATLYGQLGQWRRAVRERQAVLALGPLDLAEAYYQLAAAWLEAGEPEAARREVLRALEVAPAYERAQELLLRIKEGRP